MLGIGTIRNVGRGQVQGPPPPHVSCREASDVAPEFLPTVPSLPCLHLWPGGGQKAGRWSQVVGYHAVFIVAWMGLFPISESVPALGRQFPEGTGGVCSFSASTEKRHSKFFVDT